MGAPVFCDGEGCGVRTFIEQVAGLTARYARCTVLWRARVDRGWRWLVGPGPGWLRRWGYRRPGARCCG